MAVKKVCVYCASSDRVNEEYLSSAERLGRILAKNKTTIVYGGGSVGLMGRLADGALDEGGKVVGIIPRFMEKLEWGHRGISELKVVDDIHERKRLMMEGTDAACAMPGGSGTFEELFEAITWKRLGLYPKPIVIVNVRHFFDPLAQLLENAVSEKFMSERHRKMWTLVDSPDDVLDVVASTPAWTADITGER